MPTLLRVIVVLLSTGVLYAGIALLAFAEVIGAPDAWRLAVGSLAVCGLALPPMLAGMFASYWSWDDGARRRLRVSLGILLMVQLAGAVGLVVLTFAEVIGAPDAWRLAVGSLAVCGLALPPMLAGMFASYWSWDDGARRRLRVSLGILLVMQLAGAVGLVVLTIGRDGLIPAAVVLVVIGAALDPASIALGRAARRAELRRPVPDRGLDEFRARIATGWRRGGIGAAIGLAAGILVGVVLLLPLARGGDAAHAVLFAPIGAGLGASVGMLTVTVGMAGRIRDLLGGDYSSARRVGRAVSGKPELLGPDEEQRAARYAAAAPAWLRLQLTQSTVNSLAVVALLTALLLGRSSDDLPGFGWVAGALIVLMLVVIVSALVLLRTRLRRIQTFAAAHPLTD